MKQIITFFSFYLTGALTFNYCSANPPLDQHGLGGLGSSVEQAPPPYFGGGKSFLKHMNPQLSELQDLKNKALTVQAQIRQYISFLEPYSRGNILIESQLRLAMQSLDSFNIELANASTKNDAMAMKNAIDMLESRTHLLAALVTAQKEINAEQQFNGNMSRSENGYNTRNW